MTTTPRIPITPRLITQLQEFNDLKENALHPHRHPAWITLNAVLEHQRQPSNYITQIPDLAKAMNCSPQAARNRAHDAIATGLLQDVGRGGKGSTMCLVPTKNTAHLNPYRKPLEAKARVIYDRWGFYPT